MEYLTRANPAQYHMFDQAVFVGLQTRRPAIPDLSVFREAGMHRAAQFDNLKEWVALTEVAVLLLC